MTAFVRLSNKKHLQHASRHAELHFSDGLGIMAHSPKAFLLTFHLLVRNRITNTRKLFKKPHL